MLRGGCLKCVRQHDVFCTGPGAKPYAAFGRLLLQLVRS